MLLVLSANFRHYLYIINISLTFAIFLHYIYFSHPMIIMLSQLISLDSRLVRIWWRKRRSWGRKETGIRWAGPCNHNINTVIPWDSHCHSFPLPVSHEMDYEIESHGPSNSHFVSFSLSLRLSSRLVPPWSECVAEGVREDRRDEKRSGSSGVNVVSRYDLFAFSYFLSGTRFSSDTTLIKG